MSYIDGFLLAVPNDKREAYRDLAAKMWPLFKKWGALRHVECWSDGVAHGKTKESHGSDPVSNFDRHNGAKLERFGCEIAGRSCSMAAS
jgi:hypothetical protein